MAYFIERQVQPDRVDQEYLNQLVAEKESVDPSLESTHEILQKEIDRVSKGGHRHEHRDVVSTKLSKVTMKVTIPDGDNKINYTGRLLGPKGNTLKRLQEETQTKMSILGSGSVRDIDREKEMLDDGDPKYQHLKEPLHLRIDALAPIPEAYRRLAFAMNEVRKFLIPEYEEEIVNAQLQELAALKGGSGREDRKSRSNSSYQPKATYDYGHSGAAAALPAPPLPAASRGRGLIPRARLPPPPPPSAYAPIPDPYVDEVAYSRSYGADDLYGVSTAVPAAHARPRGRGAPPARGRGLYDRYKPY